MYRLYSRPGSGGFVAEAALKLADVPYEVVSLARSDVDDAFLAISPLGQVPALTLPDGRTITESAAIVTLIADLHPRSRLAPDIRADDRPDFLRWLAFMSSVIYPADLRYFYAERYTSDPAGIEGVKAAALAEMDRSFAIMERWMTGRDYLVGNQFSIADVYLVMLTHWHPVADCPRPEWKSLTAHAARMRAMPALAALNAFYRIW